MTTSAGRDFDPVRDIDRGKHGAALNSNSVIMLFVTAVWFSLVAGFFEGVEFLVFQHVNWAGWARTMHVSKQILWISPVVDLCFFLLAAIIIAVVSGIYRRIPAQRVLIFLLTFLTAFDWLMVTGRLYRRACLLLALGIAATVVRWLSKRESSTVAFFRRSAPWLLASLMLIAFGMESAMWLNEAHATASLRAASAGSPDVLVIVVDTLRADHLSSYGYVRPTTPNLDKLAEHGVLFENAIAPSSWSLPSHASLLTGHPVHEHGWGNVRPIPWLGWRRSALNGLPTLGEALQQRGYRTGAFSANRVYFTSNVGLGRGFIHFEDYFEGAGDAFVRTELGRQFARLYMNRSKRSIFTRAIQSLGLASWLDKDSEGSGLYGGAFGVRKRADKVNRETLRWIGRDSKHPFFAFLNYFDVHLAYGGPESYPKPEWDHGATPDEYDAGLKYEDDFIGRLLAQLNERGILRNTIVVITSDHGESLGDHGLSHHGAALYRELIRVPLIISYPGHIPEALRVEQPVSNAAIASTVMDLIGDHESAFPGPSLATFWQDPSAVEHWPDAVSELPQTNTIVPEDRMMQGKEPLATDGSMRSIFTAQWQLIQHDKWPDQIYDWKADPKESKNLIDTPEGKTARDEILNHARQ